MRQREDHDDRDIGQEGDRHAAAVERDFRVFPFTDDGAFDGFLRLPHLQEGDQCRSTGKRTENVGQGHRDPGRADELRHGIGKTGNQRRQPCLAKTSAAVDDPDEDQRNEHRKDRRLATDDRAQLVIRQAGYGGQCGDRNAERAEGDRRGIGHKRAECGFQRIHADCDHHHARNGDRRSGTGKRLEQAAEAECDDDRLDTQVRADYPETAPQDVEISRLHHHVVDPDGIDDDQDDRKNTERRTIKRGIGGDRNRHAVDDDGNPHRNDERA
ncbi:hypothetical protein D3C73_679070 [compost metagenome]